MNGFALHLQGAAQYSRFDEVESFVGEDPSGGFGLLARHERFMTPVLFGLARFRPMDRDWVYLATTGGIAYFVDDALYVSTRRFIVGDDYDSISSKLATELAAEEDKTRELRDSLRHIEEAMLRRLWQLNRSEGAGP